MEYEILLKFKAACESKDFDSAMTILTPVAESGDPEAQYLLGNLYFEGADIEAALAVKWIDLAAAQSHAEATLALAHFRPSEWVELAKRAAELGSAEAHSGLGGYYATGNWGENPGLKNEVKAAEHYTAAADHGHIEAQYNLATMILFGEGCDQNTNKAVDLLDEAAHQGQADAPKVLFELYQKGLDGVEKNPEKATYWKKVAKELEDEI